jgi:hypothetical protein
LTLDDSACVAMIVVMASYENQVQCCRDGEGRKSTALLTHPALIDNESIIADQSNILEDLSAEPGLEDKLVSLYEDCIEEVRMDSREFSL